MLPRNLLLLLLALCVLPVPTTAQTGRVLDDLVLDSSILGREMRYAVYLPPDYDTSQRSYPVLYLLHGGGDDHTGWVQFGEVLHIADRAIADGGATPMVIVMPDASGPPRGWTNSVDDRWRFEDFFFDELMPAVERTYRIRAEKRYRAVSGLSMGGHGTFVYALHRPDLFAAAAPLSAATGSANISQARTRFGEAVAGLSDDELTARLRRTSVLDLVADAGDDLLKSVRWYIDCGDDDFLYEGNALLHIALRKREIPHEYRVRDGAHNWTYWRTALPDVLAFVSAGFHQF